MQFLRSLDIDYYQERYLFYYCWLFFRFIPLQFIKLPLISGLMFVGVFYMFASTHKTKVLLDCICIWESYYYILLGSGFFHELLLWGSFFIMIYFLTYPQKYWVRLSIILAGFVFAYFIQFAKTDYREFFGLVNWNRVLKLGLLFLQLIKMLQSLMIWPKTNLAILLLELTRDG